MKYLLAGGMFLVGYGVGICPSCICSIASVLIGALLCYIAWHKYPKRSEPRMAAGGFFLGSLFRVAAIVLCAILVDRSSYASNILLRVFTVNPLAAIVMGVTPDQVLYRNEERVKLAAQGPGIVVGTHRSRPKPDPFSGEPFLSAGGKLYSVGPDLVDSRLAIAYDPTNGTVSGGDIAVRGPGGK